MPFFVKEIQIEASLFQALQLRHGLVDVAGILLAYLLSLCNGKKGQRSGQLTQMIPEDYL